MKSSFTQQDVENNIERMLMCFPQLGMGINKIRGVIPTIKENYQKLAFPLHPNWTYCIPIIPSYKTKDGRVLDLGIHIEEDWILSRGVYNGLSANYVSSNEAPDYRSGDIRLTSEESKRVLQRLLQWDVIDQIYLMKSLCGHNGMLNTFMNSDLTSWDLQDWLESHLEKDDENITSL